MTTNLRQEKEGGAEELKDVAECGGVAVPMLERSPDVTGATWDAL